MWIASIAAVAIGSSISLASAAPFRVTAADAAATQIVPVVPVRLLDTRTGIGAAPIKLAGGGIVELLVTGPTSGVPDDAAAVALNVTATEADADGFITVWPCGAERPTASNLNVTAGGTIPNLVVAKVGAAGKVCLFAQRGTHLIADLNAFWVAAGTTSPTADQILSLTPRQPGDVGLFSSVFQPSATDGLYPAGPAMAPAAGPVLTEQEVRDQLGPFLDVWHGGNTGKVNDGLAVYDDAQVKALIPEPANRAALASLKGTIWDAEIDSFLKSGFFDGSRNGGLPNTVMSRSALNPVTSKFTIIFNSRYAGEHFSRKIGLWVHEIGHHDGLATGEEESVLHGLMAMAWAQVLSRFPAIAYEDTELTRVQNSYAMAFLNSRESGSPNSEIVATTGTGVAPGSTDNAPDFRGFIGMTAGATPAPSTLAAIMSSLGLTNTTEYGTTLLESFEHLNDTWLTDVQRVQLSVLLQLVTPAEAAVATGSGEQQVIDAMGLQPYLAAMP